MFNERATYRLHHPVRSIPELVFAPDGQIDTALATRVINAFQGTSHGHAGPVWEPLVREKQGELQHGLMCRDASLVGRELSSLGRSRAAQGFFGGEAQQSKCERDPAFAQLLSAWTYDKLLSLAEAVGAVRLELPETGPWGETILIPPAQLWAAIEGTLGVDLSPPIHVGGYLGIQAGQHVVQMRMLEAIYAAFRLNQLCQQRGLRRVCEIGAGAGLTAYYALLFGIKEYVIIDLPTMNAVQGYVLAGSRLGDQVGLFEEHHEGKHLRILPPDEFKKLPSNSIDLLYNQDSLPEIERGAATGYLSDAARLGIPLILSINQEAQLPTEDGHQLSVPELVATAGSYRRNSRHRHWLREGYVEELFDLV